MSYRCLAAVCLAVALMVFSPILAFAQSTEGPR
ncbi:uncharacterized protein METZ01_LOCUS486199, partial [marine metagenome]